MLRQRRARVVSEELRDGSDLFSILAHLPVQVRGSGQARIPAVLAADSMWLDGSDAAQAKGFICLTAARPARPTMDGAKQPAMRVWAHVVVVYRPAAGALHSSGVLLTG